MIKCLYDENCAGHYPECKSTCGMTMTELAFRKDRVAGRTGYAH